MGWSTLYVHGRAGFEEEVLDHLEHSNIGFMPGSTAGEQNIGLFWVDERTNIKAFKRAIGGKTVFKYRLRFFTSLEDLQKFQDYQISVEKFTPQEEALIREMSHWDETHGHYKHSA